MFQPPMWSSLSTCQQEYTNNYKSIRATPKLNIIMQPEYKFTVER